MLEFLTVTLVSGAICKATWKYNSLLQGIQLLLVSVILIVIIVAVTFQICGCYEINAVLGSRDARFGILLACGSALAGSCHLLRTLIRFKK